MKKSTVAPPPAGMQSFVEEDLEFLFPVQWPVEKWDRPGGFYQQHGQSVPDTKAIDFIFQDHRKAVCLLEAKDYRRRRIENKEKMEGLLAKEVASKIQDTVAVLFAAFRCGTRDELTAFTSALFSSPNAPLEAVVLVAEDRTAMRRNRQHLERQLNEMLRNYRIRVKVLDGATIPVDASWQVRSLASSRSLNAPAHAGRQRNDT